MPLFPLALIITTRCLAQASPTWPSVPGGVVWVSGGGEVKSTPAKNAPNRANGQISVTLPAPGHGPGESIEILSSVDDDRPIATCLGKFISFSGGVITVGPDVPMFRRWAKVGHPLDLVIVSRVADVAIFANGEYLAGIEAKASVRITYVRSDWKKSLLGLATFPSRLSPEQIARNSRVAQLYSASLARPGPIATVDLELGAFTPVPDPSRIKPYRNALVAEEYKVIAVVNRGATSLKPGDVVRVFRYGVLDGKQTSLKNLKSGDRMRLKIEPMTAAAHVVQNEYQLDDLNTSYGAYYVEVVES